MRDYGGWAVPGGGRVKTGLLWRSGHHIGASDDDLELFQDLDVRTIVDLRGNSERSSFPCRRHSEFSAKIIAYDGETSSSPPHEGGWDKTDMTAEKARQRMIAVYTRMPVNPAMIAMFSRYFEALEICNGASLVHCFAGKDRTGIAVSLLLHVLGVSYGDIVAEFMLTNEAPTMRILEDQSLPRMQSLYDVIEPDALRNLLGVREEYVGTYWRKVERDHGSIDTYLAETLGLDEARKARLRARFIS